MSRITLSGAAAIARALADAGVRAAYSFPGSPATKVSQALAKDARVRHAYTVSEAVAATMTLASSALSGWGAACVVKHVGLNVALDALATGAQMNEYRSPCLFIEGIDAKPRTSQNEQDNRALWASHARTVALEPGSPQECYDVTRFGAEMSRRLGMPVAVRAEERVLSAEEEIEIGAAEPHRQPAWDQPVPFISTAATCGYHSRRREVLLSRVEIPSSRSPGAGRTGYLIAGQLGAIAQRDAPTLRLGGCFPLPREAIARFVTEGQLERLVVVEEGLPLLLEAVRALGLPTRIESGAIAESIPSPPLSLPPIPASGAPLESFAAAFARGKAAMKGFAEGDPRLALFRELRALPRRTIVCTDPGVTGVLGIRDGFVDLKLQMGCAAPSAGAIADAGVDALVVAVMGDTNFYHSELQGVIDNVLGGRDVLHVLVVNRKSEMTAGIRTPYLDDGALDAMLTAAGLTVYPSVAVAAAARGPRIVVFRTETTVAADA